MHDCQPGDHEALALRLAADGLLSGDDTGWRTTRRWQGAMMRVASRLVADEPGAEDLRLPIAMALLDVYGTEVPDEDLAALVETLLPIEVRELAPAAGPVSARAPERRRA